MVPHACALSHFVVESFGVVMSLHESLLLVG